MTKKELIQHFNISASAIGCYDSCPFKWAQQYHFKNTQKDDVSLKALNIGIAMHELIEHFYLNYKTIMWSSDWLQDNWKSYYLKYIGKDKRSEDLAEGYKALKKLYKILQERDWLYPPTNLGGESGLEYYFKFMFKGHKKYKVNLSGKIDLVLDRHGELCVIDWKTGKSEFWQADTLFDSVQLILYSTAMKKMFDIDDEKLYLVYFYVNKVKEFTVEDEHFQHLKKKINKILDKYDVQQFAKKPTFFCKWCEFNTYCSSTTKTIKSL